MQHETKYVRTTEKMAPLPPRERKIVWRSVHGCKVFYNPKLKYQTVLSKKFWELREKDLNRQIDWEIIGFPQTPNYFKARCNLFLEEKIRIIKFNNQNILLNKRNELVSK